MFLLFLKGQRSQVRVSNPTIRDDRRTFEGIKNATATEINGLLTTYNQPLTWNLNVRKKRRSKYPYSSICVLFKFSNISRHIKLLYQKTSIYLLINLVTKECLITFVKYIFHFMLKYQRNFIFHMPYRNFND